MPLRGAFTTRPDNGVHVWFLLRDLIPFLNVEHIAIGEVHGKDEELNRVSGSVARTRFS